MPASGLRELYCKSWCLQVDNSTKSADAPKWSMTKQGCWNTMPYFSDMGNFTDVQVEFSSRVARRQVEIWGVII